TTAPMNVPTCRATSKVLLRSLKLSSACQPNSHGTRIRWPLEEMGRNSDRPWVMPSTMACRTGMWGWAAASILGSGGARGGNDAGPPLAGSIVLMPHGRATSGRGQERRGVGEVGHLQIGGAHGGGLVGVAGRTAGQVELLGEGAGLRVEVAQRRLGVEHLDHVEGA